MNLVKIRNVIDPMIEGKEKKIQDNELKGSLRF